MPRRLPAWVRLSEIAPEVREEIVDGLRLGVINGNMINFGRADWVPPDDWSGEVDWEASRLQVNDVWYPVWLKRDDVHRYFGAFPLRGPEPELLAAPRRLRLLPTLGKARAAVARPTIGKVSRGSLSSTGIRRAFRRRKPSWSRSSLSGSWMSATARSRKERSAVTSRLSGKNCIARTRTLTSRLPASRGW